MDEERKDEVEGHGMPLVLDAPMAPAAAVPIWRPLLAGLGAAIAGAVVWGLIVVTTDYEVGFVAWGIGALAGYAVVLASGGARGLPLQAIAVASALVGILLGKYISFWWIVHEEAEQFGIAGSYGLLSGDTFSLFRDELGTVFSWFDLLWVGLAVFTAWRLTQPEEPEAAPAAP